MIRASWRRPSGPGVYQAGSSPPSPVLAAPPARWIPIVSAWCASGLSAPTLIAETTKRRTIDRASSTSASGVARPCGSDPQLIARDRAVGRRAGECLAIASESLVDLGRSDAIATADRQERDLAGDLRREEVGLAVGPEAREPGVREAHLAAGDGLRDRQRGRTAPDLPLGEVGEGRPAGPRRGGREAARDDRRVEVDDIDERPTDVRRDGADPHPGQRLAQTRLEGGHELADRLGRGQRLGAARPGELGRELDGEPRVDDRRADGQDHRHRMNVEDVGGADCEVRATAKAGCGERGVNGPDGQDRRDG